MDRDFDECLHETGERHVTKAITINDAPLLLRVAAQEAALEVTILHGKNDPATRNALSDYVINWLDVDRDLQPIYAKLAGNCCQGITCP